MRLEGTPLCAVTADAISIGIVSASCLAYLLTGLMYALRPSSFVRLAVHQEPLDHLSALCWSDAPDCVEAKDNQVRVVRVRHPLWRPGRPLRWVSWFASVLVVDRERSRISTVSVTSLMMVELLPVGLVFATKLSPGFWIATVGLVLAAAFGVLVQEPLWLTIAENTPSSTAEPPDGTEEPTN